MKISRIIYCPREERNLFIRYYIVFLGISIIVKYIPLRYYLSLICSNKLANIENDITKKVIADRTFIRIIKYFPFKSSCLTRSILKKRIYHKLGLYASISLIAKKYNNELIAHAFVCTNYTKSDYAILKTF